MHYVKIACHSYLLSGIFYVKLNNFWIDLTLKNKCKWDSFDKSACFTSWKWFHQLNKQQVIFALLIGINLKCQEMSAIVYSVSIEEYYP